MSKYPRIYEIRGISPETGKSRITKVMIESVEKEEKFKKILDGVYDQMRKDGYPEAAIEAYRSGMIPQ